MWIRQIIKNAAKMAPVLATRVDHGIFALQHIGALAPICESDDTIVSEITEKGYYIIPNFMSCDLCERVIEDFEYVAKERPDRIRHYSDVRLFGMEEVSAAARQFYKHPLLIALADHYSKVKTYNAFTMFNYVETKSGSLGSGEGWHKDMSFRQFKAFLYLRDVGEDDGPFQLIEHSHRIRDYISDIRTGKLGFRGLRITQAQIDRILEHDPSRLRTLTGKAGTVILADTSSIHRGKPPSGGRRYALTNYYVERSNLTQSFADAYQPVNPEKILRLRESMSGLKH